MGELQVPDPGDCQLRTGLPPPQALHILCKCCSNFLFIGITKVVKNCVKRHVNFVRYQVMMYYLCIFICISQTAKFSSTFYNIIKYDLLLHACKFINLKYTSMYESLHLL